jgi:RNA polymerase sigma-32 factor
MNEIGNPDDAHKASAFDLDADAPAKPTAVTKPPVTKATAKAAKDDVNLDPAALYRAEIRRFPMLKRREEFLLAKRWREHGDLEAGNRLVTSHLRLVVSIAKKSITYYDADQYRQHLLGAISAGNDALLRAVKSFDPSVGYRFSSYAEVAIRRAIKDHIWRSRSIVKISDDFNEMLFALTLEKNKIGRLDDNALTRDEVKHIAERLGDKIKPIAKRLDDKTKDSAERLGLSEEEAAVIYLNRRLGGADVSLNAPIDAKADDDDDKVEGQDLLEDKAPDPQAQLIEAEEDPIRREALRWAAVAVLDERERCIFEARHFTDPPITRPVLAAEFGVTSERVRQIEVCAVEKVCASEKVQQVLKGRTPQPVRSAAREHMRARVHATCYFGGPPDWRDRLPPEWKLVDGLTREWYRLLKRCYEHSPRWSPRWRKIVREITRKRRRAIECPSTVPVRRMLSLFSLGEGIGRGLSLLEGKGRDVESLILAPPDRRLRDQLEAEDKIEAGVDEAVALQAEKYEEEDAADCVDCDVRLHRIGEWFMVPNEFWPWKRRKSWRPFGTRPRETICTGCLERRIGGELVLANFTCSPSVHASDLSAIKHKLIFGHFAIGGKRSPWSSRVNEVRGRNEPVPVFTLSTWRDRPWDQKQGKPKTDWPAIRGKPFVVRRQAKDDLRATAAAALEAFLAERSRRPPRAMKLTWFPDRQGRILMVREAIWENGQLAQFERDKWLAERDAAPGKLEPQPLLGPRYPSAKSTQAYAGYSSLPVELRMLALRLPLPHPPAEFAMAAE